MSKAEFSSKDLALLLPDQVGDAFTMMHTEDSTALDVATVEGFVPKIDTSKKVSRLRAGQAPADLHEYENDEEEGAFDFRAGAASSATSSAEVQAMAAANAAAQAVGSSGRRPSRWDSAEPVASTSKAPDSDEEPVRRRRVAAAVLEEEEDEDEMVPGDITASQSMVENVEEDEEEIAARRARVRERMRRQRAEEEEEEEEEEAEEEEAKADTSTSAVDIAAAPRPAGGRARARPEEDEVEEEEEEEEESSEYETDSEDDDTGGPGVQLLKPVFVAKSKRLTLQEAADQAAKDEAKAKAAKAAAEARKQETRNLVAEQIRREDLEAASTLGAGQGGDEEGTGLPDDTDDLDDPVEFEAWRLRELKRLQRDGALRQQFELEKTETERRRGLTEEQRRAEDQALGKLDVKEKEKWSFMQKYYHKGAFYMDSTEMDQGDVRTKKYAEPTLEDKFDKSALPKVMQVKKFGFSGRTKYTHLKDQDTTDYESAWMQDTGSGKRKLLDEKLSGLGDIDSAGRKRVNKKP